jgi:hypothetical protein
MVQQVREALPGDRDRQLRHVREIGLPQPSRHMPLDEEHLAATA